MKVATYRNGIGERANVHVVFAPVVMLSASSHGELAKLCEGFRVVLVDTSGRATSAVAESDNVFNVVEQAFRILDDCGTLVRL